MVETKKHKELKVCAARVFHGLTETTVNGRVDVKAQNFCVEVETSGRTDRLQHAIEKLSSSKCKGGFLVVPPNVLGKATEMIQNKNIITLPSDKFIDICKSAKK